MFPTLEDGVVGMRDEVLEMGLLIRRRRNLVLPTVTCDKSHIVCDIQTFQTFWEILMCLDFWDFSTPFLDTEVDRSLVDKT